MAYRRSVHIHGLPNTWLGRLLVAALAAALLILAFFFLSFVLIAVGVMMLVGLVRLLLPGRKARAPASDESIEGEYSVEPDDPSLIESERQIPPKN